MKAIEQYSHVVTFVMLYKVVLTFSKSVNETLLCDDLNECYGAVLSGGTVNYTAQGGSGF